MPVISALVYQVTASTIVATWTTDVSSDSYLFAGSKPAIDNGVAPNGTSHQCVVTDLLPGTKYLCHVSSGGTLSTTSVQTTNAPDNRILVTGCGNNLFTNQATAPPGDTYRTFVSNDGNTYITQDDGQGFILGSPTAGYNTQLGLLTNEVTMAGTFVSLANYLAQATFSGTDGPGGNQMQNKSTGLFGLNGNLHMFVYRQYPPSYTTNRYCNWIKSTNHGGTWNNFTALSTFVAAGNVLTPQSPAEPIQFYTLTLGTVTPVLYAADDGTLGYNTAGNQIDGANAYVYMTYFQDLVPLFLLRMPRIQFDAQSSTAFEYWVGPASPVALDFVKGSNWSSSPASATNILPTANQGAWVQMAFIPTINSYIMTTWDALAGPQTRTHVYAAPTPAGPWVSVYTQVNPTVGRQWYGPFPFHRDCLSNVLTNNIPIKILYSGEPSGSNYKPTYSTLTLLTDVNGAPPPIAVRQSNLNAGGTSANPTISLGLPVVAGNLLTVLNNFFGGTCTTMTISDNLSDGVSWTAVWGSIQTPAGGAATKFIRGWFKLVGANVQASPVISISSNASGTGATELAIAEWTGFHGTATLDQAIASAAGGSQLLLPLSFALTLPNQAIFGLELQSGNGYVVPPTINAPCALVAGVSNVAVIGGAVGAPVTTVLGGSWGGNIIANTTLIGAGFTISNGTFSISGIAAPGATISYTGTASGSVTADAAGGYTIPNLGAGTYTVTPSLAGYTFSPASRSVTITSSNATGVNFTQVVIPAQTGAGGNRFGYDFRF